MLSEDMIRAYRSTVAQETHRSIAVKGRNKWIKRTQRMREEWERTQNSDAGRPKPPVKASHPQRRRQPGSLRGSGLGTSAQWGKGRRQTFIYHEKGN